MKNKRPPLIAPFNPLAWQVPAWRDKSLVLLLTGSAGGGKSRLAGEKVHASCLKYPGANWLIMRKAREWNSKSIVPFMLESVIGHDPRVKLLKSDGAFEYDNGSVIYSGGMKDDSQREAIRSIGGSGGLDGVWMEEANAFTRQDFEEALGRLRHDAMGWRQFIITTNPGAPNHWIYQSLIKNKEAAVYYSGARDNPNNPLEYLEILERMTGTQRARLVLGQWTQAQGAVYDKFDYATHVTERNPKDFTRWFLGCDEGYTNPAVILIVGEDGDGRLHVGREFYKRGVLQSDYVSVAREWSLEFEAVAFVDEAAAGLIGDMQANGILAEGSKGRILDGIQRLQDALKVAGDGRPRLTVDPSCVNLINEFESYVWKADRDEPVKEFDHALDALRYVAIKLVDAGDVMAFGV